MPEKYAHEVRNDGSTDGQGTARSVPVSGNAGVVTGPSGLGPAPMRQAALPSERSRGDPAADPSGAPGTGSRTHGAAGFSGEQLEEPIGADLPDRAGDHRSVIDEAKRDTIAKTPGDVVVMHDRTVEQQGAGVPSAGPGELGADSYGGTAVKGPAGTAPDSRISVTQLGNIVGPESSSGPQVEVVPNGLEVPVRDGIDADSDSIPDIDSGLDTG